MGHLPYSINRTTWLWLTPEAATFWLWLTAEAAENDGEIIVEVKTVQKLAPIHQAQLLSYLRLANIERGLLINFHALRLADGIKRLSIGKNKKP